MNAMSISRSVTYVLLRHRLDRDDVDFIDDFPEMIADLLQFIQPVVNTPEDKEFQIKDVLMTASKFSDRLSLIIDNLPWMTSEIRSRSLKLFEISYEKGYLKRRNAELLYLGCVICSCYELNYPFLIEDMVVLMGRYDFQRDKVWSYTRFVLNEVLGLQNYPQISPYSYIERFAESLELEPMILIYCLEISELIGRKLKKHQPINIAAAVIYLASKLALRRIHQHVIADVLGCHEITLRIIRRKIDLNPEFKRISRIHPSYIVEYFMSCNLGVSFLRKGDISRMEGIFNSVSRSKRPLPDRAMEVMRYNYRQYDRTLLADVQIFDQGTLNFYLAICYNFESEFDAAKEQIQKSIALRLHPLDLIDAKINLGNIHYILKEYSKSNKLFQVVVKELEGYDLYSSLVAAMNNLAHIQIIQGNYEIAEETLTKAYEISVEYNLLDTKISILENIELIKQLGKKEEITQNYTDLREVTKLLREREEMLISSFIRM